jgi:OHCU decarboxylase
VIDLEQLNSVDPAQFVALLGGIYEHSPWIAERAAARRPFVSLAALKYAMQQEVLQATADEQLGLIRAHPELAGKAALAGQLTAESTHEQKTAGLNQCSAEEYAHLQQLNADYNAKFGFPFILAVKGPDGLGLSRSQIIASFARRLHAGRDAERIECLHQIGRIAEIRLNDLFGVTLGYGAQIMQWAKQLATHSEQADGLTCSYLSDAHRQTAQQLAHWMREAGLQVQIDAVGNVRGRYVCPNPAAQTLLTGSHYDTVVDAGWYDGRLGILLPLAVLAERRRCQAPDLPFHVELIAFAEEEGVRFKSTLLGSRALTGRFDQAAFLARDANGIVLADALRTAGLDAQQVTQLALDPNQLCGFVEVHIEQGPVLLQQAMPLGVVTAIAGSTRRHLYLTGQANHAGTTPMDLRFDAVTAAAEIILAVEARCGGVPGLVGTVGQVAVPQGAVNVVPGQCQLSLDVRAPDDAVRLAALADIEQAVTVICQRRQIQWRWQALLEAEAVPCADHLQQQLAQCIGATGLPVAYLPSGAGHDAMEMAHLTPMAMLFVRCGNNGISHNRLETMTADDAELAARVFAELLQVFGDGT